MNKVAIVTDKAPAAIGPYSQAIQAGGVVYISGQIPLDPTTMKLVAGGFDDQVEQVFINLTEIAKAAGGSLADAIKLTVYLTDLEDFNHLNEVMSRYFNEPYPARAAVQVSALPKGANIEIDAILPISSIE